MIASFTVQNYLSFRQPVTYSFEPTSDSFMSDEYLVEVKEGVRLLKIGIIMGRMHRVKQTWSMPLIRFARLCACQQRIRQRQWMSCLFCLSAFQRRKVFLWTTFYIGTEKYSLSLLVDSQRIYQERLVYYPSSRAAVLYDRTYNAEQDS